MEQLPTKATTTEGIFLDKSNNKEKMQSVRVIHLLDTLWKYMYAVMYSGNKQAKQYDSSFPGWWHGLLRHRRREGAILVQQRVGHALRRLNIPHLNELHDLSNAFMCPSSEALLEVSTRVVIPEFQAFAKQRIMNGVVSFKLHDQRHFFLTKNGGFQGSCEMPKQFVGVFHDTIEELRSDPTYTPILAYSEVHTDAVDSPGIDVSISGFADDIFRKRVLPCGLNVQEVIEDIAENDTIMNRIFTKWSFSQNMSKKDIVPYLGSTLLNRQLQDLCPPTHGMVKAHARHLGVRYTMKGNNSVEVELRIQGMRGGWSMMGMFWHERGLRRLKRELFLSTVVEKGLTGLEAFVLTPSEHARIDTIIVRYLR
eukprot:9472934-Pyramimonas_sp.AAC.1